MLRVNTITSAAGAKQYYTQALSREDYYIDGQEITGHWHGVGARLLVLPREVSKEAFFALCDNIHPRTGDTLTVRQKANRRVGYDFTFSAPKSLAILYALKKDDRILTAFRAAVQDTMREMETAIQTQVGKGGKQPPRTTGNLVWADFIHTVTRPVEGMPDPDLHAHCVAFNTTWDRKERRWKAGEFHDLKQNAPYYEAVFHSRLAARIRTLGFGVERNGKWWDIAGVPRDLIDTFSRRSAVIKAKEQALGITDPDAKGELGARTREKKIPGLDRTTLETDWTSRPSPAQWQALEHLYSGGSSAASGGRPVTPDQAMAYAITHCFTRASVVPEKHLLETALRRGVGYVSPEEIERAAIRAGVLTRTVDGRTLVTTRKVLAEEQAMFAFARNGRGTCRMLGGVDAYRYHATTLNAGQVAAVKHVLTSHDRVMLIRGLAGTGKTTLMQQAVAAIEAQSGKQVFAFAPSSDASRGTLREAGFAEAQTVAHLFANEVLQERLRGQVMWIDEAGLMSVPDMGKLFALAGRLDTRVVLSGDSSQHSAVNRGDSLRLLETKAGLRAAEVTDILRQRDAYREAVAAIAGKNLERGFVMLDRLGWIREVAPETGHTELVNDYLETLREGKSVLVVSPTHREGAEVTRQLRAALRADGRIEAHDRTYWTLRNLYWTEAERGDADRYEPGLVVQVFQNGRGIVRGERLRVEGRDDRGHVMATASGGRTVALPLDQAQRFQVYAPDRTGIAVGDTLRVTQNGKTLNGKTVNNGDLCTVRAMTEAGDLVVTKTNRRDQEYVLGQDFAHFTHGYVTTSHASQGKTVQRVLIAQSEASLPASSLEQFYVSVSRGRESCRIYTHDTAELKARVSESSHRASATELLEGGVTARLKLVSLETLREVAAERYRRYSAQLDRVLGRPATLALVRNQEQTHERNREHGGRVMER